MKKNSLVRVLAALCLFNCVSGMAAQGLPKIIRDAADGKIEGCVVSLWVEGWANQLYVRGVFSGNFDENASSQLAAQIGSHIQTGRCRFIGSPSALPAEIQSAFRGEFPLIEVKLWVEGWANQLFVNGAFKGNFPENQNQNLVDSIRFYDIRRLPWMIRESEQGNIDGCKVEYLVEGWANQLFVRGQFAGNFPMEQTADLENAINHHLNTGRCALRGR